MAAAGGGGSKGAWLLVWWRWYGSGTMMVAAVATVYGGDERYRYEGERHGAEEDMMLRRKMLQDTVKGGAGAIDIIYKIKI